jgi:Domain of unknown function (DUF4430)
LPVEIGHRIHDNPKCIIYMKYYLNKVKFLVLASLILLIGFLFTWFNIINVAKPGQNTTSENQLTTTTTPAQKSSASLFIDFGNGKIKSYEAVEINMNETAYSLLVKKLNETGSPVVTKKYNQGLMVESIDNISASSSYFWSYSVNGQAGSVAADKHILKDKDIVEWKFTPISNSQ